MFPYITIWGIKIYMTGLAIVFALITFISISRYLCRKYSIQFWRLFYRLPGAIILMYILGSYVHFALRIGLFPSSWGELLTIISPYGYKFHFIGIVIGLSIAIGLFFKKIKRIENKKLYSDVIFFAITGSMIPLGLLLVLGDDFIGKTTNGMLGIQALHTDSNLNKFASVLPIGLWLSVGSAAIYIVAAIRKKITKKIGIGMLGLFYLLIVFNIIILHQQYPRYGIIPFGEYTLDIKQYTSIIISFILIYVYRKWKKS